MNRFLKDVTPEDVPLLSLKAYDGNAKKHDNANIDAIANSIKEFGFRQPILAWHNEDGVPEIVAGHGRAAAAKKLGMETVPVIFVDDLTDAQRRMLTHADNQTTLMTGWDDVTLDEELESLANVFDITSFGFGDPEQEDNILLDGVTEDVVPSDGDAEGKAWRLGKHVLVCGDSTDPETVRRAVELLGAPMVDLVVTDPPYNVSYGQMTDEQLKALNRRADGLVVENDSFEDEEAFIRFLSDALSNAADALKPGGAMYVWLATTHVPAFAKAYETAGVAWKQLLVWVKNSIIMGRQDYQWQHEGCMYGWKEGAPHYFQPSRKESTVFEDTKPVTKMTKQELMYEVKRLRDGDTVTDVIHCDKPAKSAEHPTMKPVKLIAQQVRNSSRKGETVLDVFGGSGTTLIACEQMGRRCATIELDPYYAQVIVRRWEELTGEIAEVIE